MRGKRFLCMAADEYKKYRGDYYAERLKSRSRSCGDAAIGVKEKKMIEEDDMRFLQSFEKLVKSVLI